MLHGAAVGDVVRNPVRTPPWIVVDHQVPTVIVTSWPGRLVAVEVIDAVTDDDLAAVRQSALLPGARYTRAVAVRLTDELVPAELFGAHGAAVIEVIEGAQRLSIETAGVLAAAVDPEAGAAYTRAWDAWLVAEGRADSIHHNTDHSNTLAIPARHRSGSPIHHGFSVISSELRTRAIAIAGEAATFIDDEGDRCLAAPWGQTCTALLYAAMALGAPEHVVRDDRAVLLRAWHALGTG